MACASLTQAPRAVHQRASHASSRPARSASKRPSPCVQPRVSSHASVSTSYLSSRREARVVSTRADASGPNEDSASAFSDDASLDDASPDAVPAGRPVPEADELVLVVGGAGRVGTRLVTTLRSMGVATRVMTRDPSSAASAALRALGAEIVRGDVTDADPARMDAAVAGCTRVVACFGAQAGVTRALPPAACIATGVTICFGGVLRDVLCRRDVAIGGQSYALATAMGASAYVGMRELVVRGVMRIPLLMRIGVAYTVTVLERIYVWYDDASDSFLRPWPPEIVEAHLPRAKEEEPRRRTTLRRATTRAPSRPSRPIGRSLPGDGRVRFSTRQSRGPMGLSLFCSDDRSCNTNTARAYITKHPRRRLRLKSTSDMLRRYKRRSALYPRAAISQSCRDWPA